MKMFTNLIHVKSSMDLIPYFIMLHKMKMFTNPYRSQYPHNCFAKRQPLPIISKKSSTFICVIDSADKRMDKQRS